MSPTTLRPFGALLLAILALACAPAADFKGGTPLADVAGPDADASSDITSDVAPADGSDVVGAACETDQQCQEAWKDTIFPCHAPVCGEDGVCTWQADEDQVACDDHNDCTENDACLDGLCVGDPLICDQGTNPCVAVVCERGKGCSGTRTTSAPCDDGDACTLGDTCGDGSCTPGVRLACDDHNVCTNDSCDNGVCVFAPTASGDCDDGNPCTTGDTCTGGACAPTGSNDCAELSDQPCKAKLCDPALGCIYAVLADDAPCDDLDACTLGDRCQGGVCSGPYELPCVDDDPCTEDKCKPSAGCWFVPVAENGECDDGDPCTAGEKCVGGDCLGNPVVCNDDDPCTLDFCDPLGGGCVAEPRDDLACSDGNPCTLGDTCQGGACKSGPLLACDDGNPCTLDNCANDGGAPKCTFVPAMVSKSCDDGNPCTNPGGSDLCEPGKGTCTGGTVKNCNDGNPCSLDFCDPKTGSCLHAAEPDDEPCSTDDLCLENARCLSGACSGDPISCDDADDCTLDTCDPDAGCGHEPATFAVDTAGCSTLGVCAGTVTVTCAEQALSCDYSAVVAYEPTGEISCDGLDNDCDGRTDEGLCGVCSAGDRVCADNDVLVCNVSGYGWELDRSCAAGSTCVGSGACVPDTEVPAVTGVDPDPARTHFLAVDADGQLLIAVPALDQGAPTVILRRVVPDTQVAEDLATLGDVTVVAMASTDDRKIHVVYQAAAGANLDLHVASFEGSTQVGVTRHPVKGFQAVAAPLVLDATTLAIPVATIGAGGQQEFRVEALDLVQDETTTLGSLPYTGYLVKRLLAARQLDGDLALLTTTNTQTAFLSRFRFASNDFRAPEELPDDPFPAALAAAPTAAFVALLELDAAGTVSVTTRLLDELAIDGTAIVGTAATATGRVRAWGRGQQVLTLWEGGTPDTPELGAALVGEGATVDTMPGPDGLAGFDPRYGKSKLGFEWVSWRTAAGEIRFLGL